LHPSKADDLDFDDENETHLARHGITPLEAHQVFVGRPIFVPNRKGLTATWLMLGDTAGGRALTVAVLCLETRRRLRPITGWNSTAGELTRWRQRGR
jgi:uncharacterized DUF497 family protein